MHSYDTLIDAAFLVNTKTNVWCKIIFRHVICNKCEKLEFYVKSHMHQKCYFLINYDKGTCTLFAKIPHIYKSPVDVWKPLKYNCNYFSSLIFAVFEIEKIWRLETIGKHRPFVADTLYFHTRWVYFAIYPEWNCFAANNFRDLNIDYMSKKITILKTFEDWFAGRNIRNDKGFANLANFPRTRIKAGLSMQKRLKIINHHYWLSPAL